MKRIDKRLILAFLCLLIIVLIFIYIKIDNSRNKSSSDYITIERCIISINTLYGENIVSQDSFKNVKSSASKKDIKVILSKAGISEGISSDIKGKNATDKEWLNILNKIIDDSGMREICQSKELSVFSVNSETNELMTDEGKYLYQGDAGEFRDKTINVVSRDNNVIFVYDINNNVVHRNVLIKSTDKENIKVVLSGTEREIRVKGLDKQFNGVMADIEMKNGEVSQLTLKRDSISGKLLAVAPDNLEVEGFGKVALSDRVRVYTTYNDYREGTMQDIIVGDTGMQFIVADKQICGIMIVETPVADNIRVLLKNSGYKDLFHDSVSVTSDGDYNVIYYENDENGNPKEITQLHKGGETVDIGTDNPILKTSRIKIVPVNTDSKITVNSISRNGKAPSYRGVIEISENNSEGKLVVINEVSLEEYLYAVVPSEMPSSYGVEALKVQAVCARSYAASHMNNGKLSKYGAQVDDSTDYQVYNTTPETENSISAVKATYGEVLKYGEEIANTYFYATSCGSTTGAEIWGGNPLPYIKGKILSKDSGDINLTDNGQFAEFIKSDYATYDSGNSWYRWSVDMSSEELTDIVNNNLNKMYNTYPDYVLTLTDNEYKSCEISSVGNVSDIYVERRGEGGIIEELVIKGSAATVKIMKQSTIRNLLNPKGIAIIKNDGTSIDTFTSFPSAFFTVEKAGKGFNFYGGGYGHGAGMSQTAVKGMIDDGMHYDEILKFFYTDINIEMIYN